MFHYSSVSSYQHLLYTSNSFHRGQQFKQWETFFTVYIPNMPSSLCMGECSERADVGDGRQLFTGRIFYGFRITFFLSLPRFLLSWGKRQTINLVLSWWTKTAQLLSIAYCEESPPSPQLPFIVFLDYRTSWTSVIKFPQD